MYKIGIIGSLQNRFKDADKAHRRLDEVMELLEFQYHSEMTFNIAGDIGTGLWAIDKCMAKDYKYHLFLPCELDETSTHWYEDQQQLLQKGYNNANSISICSSSGPDYEKTYKQIVDDSNFLVCFWGGSKQSEIYGTIGWAFTTNKMILDGLNELKMMTYEGVIG